MSEKLLDWARDWAQNHDISYCELACVCCSNRSMSQPHPYRESDVTHIRRLGVEAELCLQCIDMHCSAAVRPPEVAQKGQDAIAPLAHRFAYARFRGLKTGAGLTERPTGKARSAGRCGGVAPARFPITARRSTRGPGHRTRPCLGRRRAAGRGMPDWQSRCWLSRRSTRLFSSLLTHIRSSQ
jgi:hypothetical protein